MPQLYNNAVITDAGLVLLDRVQAGTASIQFTRMVTGDGTYTANEKTSSALQKYTGLKSEKNSYPLSSVGTVPDGGIKLTALITNQDPATGATLVSEGYYINEIGLFAREKGGADSTEVLYSIAIARGDNGDYMPPYGGHAPVQIVQEYHAKVGNATSVTISSAGAVMLAEDAQREFEDLKRMIGEGGAIGEKILTFERAKERDNIASGETLDMIMGKIEKNFADLKKIAFTGDYADLVGTPEIPSMPSSLPADGGNADSVGGKDLEYIMDYDNLDNKPVMDRTVNAMVVASGWSGESAPYMNTIRIAGVTTTSIVDISLRASPTMEQVSACASAMIVDGGQSDGSITLMAMGDKPEIDIPIVAVIR